LETWARALRIRICSDARHEEADIEERCLAQASKRVWIAALYELGIRTAMITGDNERTARFVAAQVGIAIDAADVTLVSGYVQSRTARC
jgi:hypothetical protein